MDNHKLINLLEEEMRPDISEIDFSEKKEIEITITDVKEWYFEAEKIIRVLANVLSVPMTQAINQLRYAGHHVLKAQTADVACWENLVEAYKHCKRAVYDALDFYVYKLNEYYRVLMPYLDSQSAVKLEHLLKEHIRGIFFARANNGSRIEYYQCIQAELVKGLQLVENINAIQRETGVSKELLRTKKAPLDENLKLRGFVEDLQNDNQQLKEKLEGRYAFITMGMALVLTFGVIIGLMVASAVITNKHEVNLKGKHEATLLVE